MIVKALKTEWLKSRSSLTFRIFSIVFLLSIVGAFLFIREIEFPEAMLKGSALDADNVYLFAGYAYNWIVFMLGGVLAIRLISTEFTNNTWRAAVMAGAKRWELWSYKLIYLGLISLVASAIFLISCIVASSFYSGAIASLPSLSVIARTLLITLSYLLFGAMIAWLIRRNTASILVYIGYILFIEPFLRWSVHGRLMSERHWSMHYYPMNATEDLFPNPLVILKDVTIQMGAADEEILRNLILTPSTAMLLTSLYIAVFVAISYLAVRKVNL